VLTASTLIAQVLAIGDRWPYTIALIVLAPKRPPRSRPSTASPIPPPPS
jgi:hypothetical protein